MNPTSKTSSRSTLAEAPELALELDPTVAPAITGVGPDQGLRTYFIMFDNTTGKVDFIRDER